MKQLGQLEPNFTGMMFVRFSTKTFSFHYDFSAQATLSYDAIT